MPSKRLATLFVVLFQSCAPVPPRSETPSQETSAAQANPSQGAFSTQGGGDEVGGDVEAVREEPISVDGHLLANGARADCPQEAQCRPLPAQNQLIIEYDHDGNGDVDQRNRYTYDEHGRIARMEIDVDADGATDQTIISRRTYDAEGNVLTDESDMNGDGVIDRRSWYTYDASKRMLTWTYDAADAFGQSRRGRHLRRVASRTAACDGVPDVRRTNIYNDEGNLRRTEIDYEVNGTVDQIIRYRPPCPPPYGTDTCPEYTTETPSLP